MGYFGNLDQTAGGDYDNDGVDNGTEYAYGTDPNTIAFSLIATNQYVRIGIVPLWLNVTGGVPSSVAFLVNDTNFDDAVWQPYGSSNLTISIGPGDGDYDVWVGLRGRLDTSDQTWQGTTITKDTVPPSIVVTNPTMATVVRPVVQLQGYAQEPLASLTYDLTNVAGTITNQPGFITGQYADTNTLKFTTNTFQCYDVELTNGDNTITLRATDLAGNTTVTNVTFTLDTSGATNPPVITVVWPQTNSPVAGTNFTLQGLLDDDTASVAVKLGTNTFTGLVERGGKFTVQDMPLTETTNALTVTATNTGGLGSAIPWTVVKSAVNVTMDALTADELSQSTVTVTGTTSDTGQDIWVNGIQAMVNLDGTWEADDVPMHNDAGSGSFAINVYPPGSDPNSTPPTSTQAAIVTTPPVLRPASYLNVGSFYNFSTCCDETNVSSDTLRQTWAAGLGGWSFEMDNNDYSFTNWPGDYLPVAVWQNGFYYSSYASFGHIIDCCDKERIRQNDRQVISTPLQLVGGGPAQQGEQQLVLLTISAATYSNPYDFRSGLPGDIPVLTSAVRIDGQTLVTTSTNVHVGQTLITVPYGSTKNLSVSVAGVGQSSVTGQVEAVQFKIVDGVTELDLPETNTVIVGQQINLTCKFSKTNLPLTDFQWTIPSYAISNYVADANAATVYTNFPTTQSNVVFYWVDGGYKQVECLAMVNGQRIVAKQIFNVIRPTVDFSLTVRGVIGADTNYLVPGIYEWATTPYLHFGNASSGTEGVAFSFTNVNLNGFTGSFYQIFFVQVGQTESRQCVGTNETRCRWSSYGLDTSYPYQAPSSSGGFFINELFGETSDSPGIELNQDATEAHRGDTFDIYLMFEPGIGTPDSKPVPLKKASWSWSGGATATNSSWVLTSSNYPPSVSGADVFDYPQWTTNIANTLWTTNSSNCQCP